MPLKQRVPKMKGFNNPFRVEYQAINLDTLARRAATPRSPRRARRAKGSSTRVPSSRCWAGRDHPRGRRDGARVSKAAEAAITAAGGTLTLPCRSSAAARRSRATSSPTADSPQLPAEPIKGVAVLSNLKNIFKVTDLRNKILFVMAIIALYRLGVAHPVPGIDPDAVKQFKKGVEHRGALGFLDLFSGGAFAQLLDLRPRHHAVHHRQHHHADPRRGHPQAREAAASRARSGSARSRSDTRYLAIGISLMQATGLTFIFGNGNGNAFSVLPSDCPRTSSCCPTACGRVLTS